MPKVINKPKISKWIGRMYFIVTVLILALFIWIGLIDDIRESDLSAQAFLFGVMSFVILLMGITTYGFYKTRYVIQNGRLYSWSPFAIIRLNLKDIKKVERTLIPLHFRFGASLYSGRFDNN